MRIQREGRTFTIKLGEDKNKEEISMPLGKIPEPPQSPNTQEQEELHSCIERLTEEIDEIELGTSDNENVTDEQILIMISLQNNSIKLFARPDICEKLGTYRKTVVTFLENVLKLMTTQRPPKKVIKKPKKNKKK